LILEWVQRQTLSLERIIANPEPVEEFTWAGVAASARIVSEPPSMVWNCETVLARRPCFRQVIEATRQPIYED
jgi:hypothetical protein